MQYNFTQWRASYYKVPRVSCSEKGTSLYCRLPQTGNSFKISPKWSSLWYLHWLVWYSFVWMMSQTPCNYLNYDMVKVKIVIFRKKLHFLSWNRRRHVHFVILPFFPIIDSFSDTKEIVWPQFIILERKPIHIWLEGLQAWKKKCRPYH